MKLPRTFQISTPVGNYSPDWAIVFYEGTDKHIFFVTETKGTMEKTTDYAEIKKQLQKEVQSNIEGKRDKRMGS